MSDEDLEALRRGGHDPLKIYAAYKKAIENADGKPTLILPMTVKGYGLGEWGESKILHIMLRSLILKHLIISRIDLMCLLQKMMLKTIS